MAKNTRKTGKRAVTRKRSQQRGPAKKKSGGASQPAAARRTERSNISGSGLVYTDLLREALARRRG
jgi:hypothetical protein